MPARTPSRSTRWFRLAAFATLLALAGCASAPRDDDARTSAPASRPADFTLAVSVMNPAALAPPRVRASRAGPSATPPARPAPEIRPARYIIEPDGFLRAALGPGASDRTFPPPTRRLTPEQLDALWSLVAASDWLNAEPSEQLADLSDPSDPPAPGFSIALLADRRRAHLARPLSDRSARAVAARLADWAWQSP
jgi:hypothetical protein